MEIFPAVMPEKKETFYPSNAILFPIHLWFGDFFLAPQNKGKKANFACAGFTFKFNWNDSILFIISYFKYKLLNIRF